MSCEPLTTSPTICSTFAGAHQGADCRHWREHPSAPLLTLCVGRGHPGGLHSCRWAGGQGIERGRAKHLLVPAGQPLVWVAERTLLTRLNTCLHGGLLVDAHVAYTPADGWLLLSMFCRRRRLTLLPRSPRRLAASYEPHHGWNSMFHADQHSSTVLQHSSGLLRILLLVSQPILCRSPNLACRQTCPSSLHLLARRAVCLFT